MKLLKKAILNILPDFLKTKYEYIILDTVLLLSEKNIFKISDYGNKYVCGYNNK